MAIMCRCPNCGFEIEDPVLPYEYNGQYKPWLYEILNKLRQGIRPHVIAASIGQPEAKGTIGYLALRYGIVAKNNYENQQRNAEIVRRYLNGETMTALGGEYNMTKHRVSQLVMRHLRENASSEIAINRAEEVPIEAMELSVRSYNCLRLDSIKTAGEIMQKSDAELLRIPNFGKTSLLDVHTAMRDLLEAFRQEDTPSELKRTWK